MSVDKFATIVNIYKSDDISLEVVDNRIKIKTAFFNVNKKITVSALTSYSATSDCSVHIKGVEQVNDIRESVVMKYFATGRIVLGLTFGMLLFKSQIGSEERL